MSQGPERDAGVADPPGDGGFDPGPDTGNAGRGPRRHELDPEQGARPFEPGDGVGFDDRRARRAAKRREKGERRDRELAVQERAAAEHRERERAEHAARRKQAERELREGRRPRPAAPPPRVAPIPGRHADHPQPALAPTAERTSLRGPTAKALAALAVVIGLALAAGGLLGLPIPLIGGDEDAPAAGTPDTAPASELLALDSGTPVGLTDGPYFPVVLDRPADYGEAAAKFGAPRSGRLHEGQDIFAKPGTPLVAVRDGIVVDGAGGPSFYSYGGGNDVVIYSPIDDRSYVYLHMLHPALVKEGDHVKAGQVVGQLGCTGSCDGPHLHFEVRLGRAVYGPQKKAIDPLPLLKKWPQRPTN